MDYDTVYNGATADGVKAITDALELSAYEHKKLERHQKLSQLVDEDIAYMIRKNVNYLWVDYYFDGAKDWLSIKAQKYDKRKKYTEKDAYEYLVGKLVSVCKRKVKVHKRPKCSCWQKGYWYIKDMDTCLGTREGEPCNCKGDTRKCNYYPEKRGKK